MINFVTQKPYTGNNAMELLESGFESPLWMTFRQALSIGRVVKKGEKGIRLCRVVEVEKRAKSGEVKKEKKPKYFTVFNIDQTEVNE